MANVTISKKDFSNKFDNVLLDNPTIHKILSKESNLGFTTQLVLDQLKTELTESLFAEAEETPVEPVEAETTEEAPSEETDPEDPTPTEETEEATETAGLDELDELD